MTTVVSIDAVVEKYVKIRDMKSELETAHKAKIAKVDEALSKLEVALLQEFDAVGAESIKTAHGTAYKTMRTFTNVADWDSFIETVEAKKAWFMLDRRCNKTGVLQWKEAHGELPPGINMRQEVAINVRR